MTTIDDTFKDDTFTIGKIDFPKNLELESMRELFEYVSREGQMVVSYNVTMDYTVGRVEMPPDGPDYFNADARVESAKKLSDRIVDTDNRAFDHFEAITGYVDREDDVVVVFTGMAFSLVPGWNLSEYRPETVVLWDKVRELTESYFKSGSPG